MSKGKYDTADKLAILEEVSSGEIGVLAAKKYGINRMILTKWPRRYKLYGYEGLESYTHNRSYSAELKLRENLIPFPSIKAAGPQTTQSPLNFTIIFQ